MGSSEDGMKENKLLDVGRLINSEKIKREREFDRWNLQEKNFQKLN